MLISILACSLGFHTITFERSTSTQIAIFNVVARSGTKTW